MLKWFFPFIHRDMNLKSGRITYLSHLKCRLCISLFSLRPFDCSLFRQIHIPLKLEEKACFPSNSTNKCWLKLIYRKVQRIKPLLVISQWKVRDKKKNFINRISSMIPMLFGWIRYYPRDMWIISVIMVEFKFGDGSLVQFSWFAYNNYMVKW